MADRSCRPETELEHNRLLSEYFEALLQESPDAPTAVSKADPGGLGESETVAGVGCGEEQATFAEVADDPPVMPEADSGAMAEPATPAKPPPAGSGLECNSMVPSWAYPEFQAQLFTVGRLRLAVPVVKLCSVIPWCDGIEVQPDQPSWCHGLLREQDRMVRVIDTAELVMPADRRGALAATGNSGYILIVGDGCWGLACNDVGEVVSLSWDEVKWRSQRGTRPWLAGTVLGRMCAVLDTQAFAEMFG